jgi:hypothetical protein
VRVTSFEAAEATEPAVDKLALPLWRQKKTRADVDLNDTAWTTSAAATS